jgi:two-component system OmpR family response regulator
LARIRAVLRRQNDSEAISLQRREYCFGEFTLNQGLRQVHDGKGHPVDLTAGEFELLLVLIARAGRPCVLNPDLRTHLQRRSLRSGDQTSPANLSMRPRRSIVSRIARPKILRNFGRPPLRKKP